VIEPWKVTVCCPNVVHKDGSEARRGKCIDIHTYIYIFSQFDGRTETLKAEVILANQKNCVIDMR